MISYMIDIVFILWVRKLRFKEIKYLLTVTQLVHGRKGV